MQALFRAIVDKYKEATSLLTSIGVIYVSQAPMEATKPYVILTQIGGDPPAEAFQGSLKIEGIWLQFSIYDDNFQVDGVLGYMDILKGRYDWAALTYADDGTITAISCRRMSPGTLIKDPVDSWKYDVEYWVTYQQ